MLGLTAILRSSIGEDSQQRDAFFLEERKNLVIKHIRSGNRCFFGIKLSDTVLGIGINEGLLVDMSHTFNITYVVGVLCPQVAGVVCLNFSMSLFKATGFFQGNQLIFSQNNAVL